jgi:hypothetical protein
LVFVKAGESVSFYPEQKEKRKKWIMLTERKPNPNTSNAG